MITLHKLKLFIIVYERGSFNRAAQELYLSQSAISQHMHSLEAALGTPLFERSPQGIQPTPAGDLLYSYAHKMLGLLADAEREIMQVGQAQNHQLTVSATPGISVYLLPAWLQQFQVAYPNINVSLQTVLTAEVVRDVLNGRYDLGFLEGELAELDTEHLGKMRFRDIAYNVMVNAQHPWASREIIPAAELAQTPFITRQPSSRTRHWLETTLAQYDLKLKNIAELDSPGAIKYALLNKMGAAILPDYAVEREVERGEIHPVKISEFELKRPLLFVWDKRQPFTPIQRAFITLLAQNSPQLQMLL